MFLVLIVAVFAVVSLLSAATAATTVNHAERERHTDAAVLFGAISIFFLILLVFSTML